MKKLALVLGSLLVVGSVASAKEVMPAPVAAPEVVVKVVEKPVVVYKEKEAAWKPNGQVEVSLKTEGDTRGRKKTSSESKKVKEKGWETAVLKTKGNVNFTPKQELKFEYTDKLGYKSRTNEKNESDKNSAKAEHKDTKLTHVYKFDKMMRLESEFNAYNEKVVKVRDKKNKDIKLDSARSIKEKLVFDFSDYFFKNDYVKATALELAPEYAYVWNHDGHENHFGLYANAEFDLPYGVTFQAEFDDLFAYDRAKMKNKIKGSSKTSSMELTLDKKFVYANGPHKVTGELEGKYTTEVIWNAKDKYKRVPSHEFGLEPSVKYEFAATDYVTLWSKVGVEFKYKREKEMKNVSSTRTRTYMPYAEVGFKTTF